MRRIMATGYPLFQTVYRPLFKRQAVFRLLKKGSVKSPETSATTFPPNPRNISEEIKKREEDILKFKSNVDYVLSESNATTFIEVDLKD